MSISSTHDHNHHQHHFPTTTSAPPPTPSTTQPTTSNDSTATDLLSRLLHRLPPSLSTTTTPLLLRRRSTLNINTLSTTTTTTTSPPIISFKNINSSLPATFPTISQLGYFQLTNHSIPSHLANSAESDSLSIFNLSTQQKNQHFPINWPLGFDDDEEDDVSEGPTSLFLDMSCMTESNKLELSSLREFTRQLEKVGLAVVEAVTCAMGLHNPVRDDPDAVSALMWVSKNSGCFDDKLVMGSGRFYPYVVGLHYQIRSQTCSLLTDTGLVSVLCKADSILVTLGDIAQVWSNGNLKKVRGKPTLGIEGSEDSLTMSLLVTLPLESTATPLPPRALISSTDGDTNHNDNKGEDSNKSKEERLFNSFSFEDYAWRVYHERVPLKDPLDRYRNRL